VYANLISVDVGAGESIASGARVGAMGASESGGGLLYFELRHREGTIDPSPWLGL
jgi:septal ring factor EnvC (AmiA/AmiB activator)